MYIKCKKTKTLTVMAWPWSVVWECVCVHPMYIIIHRHMAEWLVTHVYMAYTEQVFLYSTRTCQPLREYKVYRVTKSMCKILSYTNIINMNSCNKGYLKFPLFTFKNRHLSELCSFSIYHSTTRSQVSSLEIWNYLKKSTEWFLTLEE